jgi:hypothetical protein
MQPQLIGGQIKTQVILSLGTNPTVVAALSCSKLARAWIEFPIGLGFLESLDRGRDDVGNGCNYLGSGGDVESRNQSAQEVVQLLRQGR